MGKFIYVQTILTEEELADLKKLTGKETTKDALYEAVKHYLGNWPSLAPQGA